MIQWKLNTEKTQEDKQPFDKNILEKALPTNISHKDIFQVWHFTLD